MQVSGAGRTASIERAYHAAGPFGSPLIGSPPTSAVILRSPSRGRRRIPPSDVFQQRYSGPNRLEPQNDKVIHGILLGVLAMLRRQTLGVWFEGKAACLAGFRAQSEPENARPRLVANRRQSQRASRPSDCRAGQTSGEAFLDRKSVV